MSKTTPMIFNSEMVRALLAGNKTQTRRIFKQPKRSVLEEISLPWLRPTVWFPEKEKSVLLDCPFGMSGDLIYVRETFGFSDPDYYDYETPMDVVYLATLNRPATRIPEKWKPSIHMPRWASRLTLKINSVRVERIQDISEEDAKKEGVSFMRDAPDCDETLTDKDLFECLWDYIYPESWSKNHWVWVIDFEVVHKNIDQVLAEMEQAA